VNCGRADPGQLRGQWGAFGRDEFADTPGMTATVRYDGITKLGSRIKPDRCSKQ